MSESAEIPLSKGLVAIVDRADLDMLLAAGSWHAAHAGDGRYYPRLYIGNRQHIRMHKFLTGWPLVDHVNGDSLDNRRANLRLATPSQNMGNLRLAKNNTSGYKGVSPVCGGKWRASIQMDGKARNLGTYVTREEAARVYDAAAYEKWGEFARLNFPKDGAA